MVPRGVSDAISAKMVYTGPVRAPVREGQPIGHLQVWRGDAKVLEVPLQATESVAGGLDVAARLRCRFGTCDQRCSALPPNGL